MQPVIGDKLRVIGMNGLCSHYGIYIGACEPYEQAVVHNTKDCGVEVCGWEEFADDCEVNIVSRVAGPPAARIAVRDRALALVGTQYNLLTFNCEHAANFVQTGAVFSETVQVLVGIGGLLLMEAAIARA